jgi:hypothetical protein
MIDDPLDLHTLIGTSDVYTLLLHQTDRRKKEKKQQNPWGKNSTSFLHTMEKPYFLTPKELLETFKVDGENGLTQEQVIHSRVKFGVNELPPAERESLFSLVLRQFEDRLVQILLGSMIISVILAFFEEEQEQLTAVCSLLKHTHTFIVVGKENSPTVPMPFLPSLTRIFYFHTCLCLSFIFEIFSIIINHNANSFPFSVAWLGCFDDVLSSPF